MKRKSKKKIYQFNKVSVGFIVLFLLILFFIIQQLQQSILFNHKDRINIIIYDAEPILYSLGTQDDVHYKGVFDPQISFIIPGGYGNYQIKSLDELSRLEKKPKMIQQAFSSLISASIDYYYYPSNQKDLSWSNTKLIKYRTNANIIDKILIYFMISNKKSSDFSPINFNRLSYNSKTIEEYFFKEYQGYFYQNDLRTENKNVQLIFHTRSSINTLSRMIEGDGVRIVDLAYHDKIGKGCTIITNSLAPATKHYFASLYGCIIEKGDTEGQDMSIELGSDIEREWN